VAPYCIFIDEVCKIYIDRKRKPMNKDRYDPLINPTPTWHKENKAAGKGDKRRPSNEDKYRSNYDRIFDKKKKTNNKNRKKSA